MRCPYCNSRKYMAVSVITYVMEGSDVLKVSYESERKPYKCAECGASLDKEDKLSSAKKV